MVDTGKRGILNARPLSVKGLARKIFGSMLAPPARSAATKLP